MAKIGNWGRYLRFQTSDRRILTFSGMSRTMSMRTVKHQTIGTIPKIERLGRDNEQVTFTIELNALICKKPKKVEETLRKAAYMGRVAPLVIGRRRIICRAMITSISDAYDIVWKRGELYSLKMNITMMEYR